MTASTIGVDVSKAWLDVHALPAGLAKRFANDPAGHKALIRWLAKLGQPLARIVYEPTGSYHAGMERALADAGFPLAPVNPRQARRFAEACGRPAKTDRADAAMLARMGMALEPALRALPSQTVSALKQLSLARQALIKDRTAASNRQAALALPMLKRHNAQRLRQIEAQLRAIEDAIATLIAGDPELTRRLAILTSIPGIAGTTASILLIEMPELGTLEAKQAASLAGLAPIARQSGTWTGHAFIRGGRAALRRALYMPALVATRFNPDLKAKYRQLIAAGKPAKLAITAIMRKLLILANALLKQQRKWSPKIA
jgi:transposase